MSIFLIALIFACFNPSEASFNKHFRSTPTNFDKLSSEKIKNEEINFKETSFLFFDNLSTNGETKRSRIECEDELNQTVCSENILESATCRNLHYSIEVSPKWTCDFEFSNKRNSSMIVNFEVKCDKPNGLINEKPLDRSYAKNFCYLKYNLKLDLIRLAYIRDPNEKIVWGPVTIFVFVLLGFCFTHLIIKIIYECIFNPKKEQKEAGSSTFERTSCNGDCCDCCFQMCCDQFSEVLFKCCFHTVSGIASTSFR